MLFGLTNTPTTFQALMNQVFHSFPRKFVLVFFDDILVYSRNMSEHLQHLEVVLKLMKEKQLFAKSSKCISATDSVEYLGHAISSNGVSMDQAKIDSTVNWLVPDYVKTLRGFLDLSGYYRHFIKGYSIMTRPLTNLLKKDGFQWSEQAGVAFNDLNM